MTIASASDIYTELGISSPSATETAAVLLAIRRAEGAIRRELKYNPEQATHTEYAPLKSYNVLRDAVWEVTSNEAVLRFTSSEVADELQLVHLPIRSITSLAVDYDGRSGTSSGAFSTTETEGTDFWANYDGHDAAGNKFCKDGILRSIGTWPTTPGSVKVVYVAGYSSSEFAGDDPSLDATPIWDAALTEAARRAKNALANGKSDTLGFIAGVIEAERMGDYNYKINADTAKRLFGGMWDLLPESIEKLAPFVNYGHALEG